MASADMSWKDATDVDAFSDTGGTADGDCCVGMDSDDAKWTLLCRSKLALDILN